MEHVLAIAHLVILEKHALKAAVTDFMELTVLNFVGDVKMKIFVPQ